VNNVRNQEEEEIKSRGSQNYLTDRVLSESVKTKIHTILLPVVLYGL